MSEQVNTSDANGLTINDSGNRTTYQLPVVPNHWQPSYIPRTGREVLEHADRRLQTRRMPLWNALDCFITENLVLPVMYDSVHSVLVKQHGYIQWTNCTKNTLLGNQITFFKSVKLAILQF